MSKFAVTLKSEIVRLAKREVKKAISPLLETARKHKLALVSLKASVNALRHQTAEPSKATLPAVTDTDVKKARFSGRLVKKLRIRLGLSQAGLGALVGTSLLTVGNWERGTSRPDERNQRALIAVRKLGKRAIKQLVRQKGTVTKG